jgi:ribosomal protein L11 methyltransferase
MFWELRVPTSPETSEGLTNFLWEHGALGVVEEEWPGHPPCLRAFYPESASTTRLQAAVNEYRAALGALGFAIASAEPEIGPVRDADWASAWQQSFPPRPIGDRLLVRPPWDAGASPDRIAVIIEPARAFGTGHHGSTEGCLALLDTAAQAWPRARAAPRILDIGTGTGILAIAAIKLGAPRVRAIDVDPDAVAAAAHNAELNECREQIDLGLEGAEALDDGAFGLVLANLLTHTHLALGAQYRRLVAPGGFLVLGGMLADEDQRVALALTGFTATARLVVDGWSSLLLRRDEAARG